MSGLHFLVWPVHFSWSLQRTLECDAFTSALWRLLVMSLTVVLCFFFTALTMSCHQLLMFSFVYQLDICCWVHQWFLSSSGHSKWLYWLWSMFVQCFWLIFYLLLASKWLAFLPIDGCLVFTLVTPFQLWMQFAKANPKAETKSRHSVLFIGWIIYVIGHTWAAKNTCQSHVPIFLLAWKMGGFKCYLLRLFFFFQNRFKCKCLEMEADLLISCLIFVFWCQTQIFSVKELASLFQ